MPICAQKDRNDLQPSTTAAMCCHQGDTHPHPPITPFLLAAKKHIGCFNCRVVTLVADKLKRVVMLWYEILNAQGTQDAAAQFLLQPQYTDNP